MPNEQKAVSSTPAAWYLDPDVFEQEQERIFRGRTWHYLGLAGDVSGAGDFVTANVGTTPVVLNRDVHGLHAFVNRCAHRGALVVRQPRGNCDKHICPLHRWAYDHAGRLLGGDNSGIRLQPLRTDSCHELVFGTLDAGAPALSDYLTEPVCRRLGILCGRPLRALGHHRHSVKANWKLYIERLLASHGRFGMLPLYPDAPHIERAGFHNSWTTYSEKDDAGRYRSILHRVEVEGGGEVPFFREHEDGTASIVLFVFPGLVLAKVENHLQLRHIVPKSADAFEIAWTNYAYADDSAEHVQARRAQARLLDLGSPCSSEDAQELEAAHEALRNSHAGGDTRTEPAARAASDVTSWKPYRDLMGLAPDP